MTLSLQAPVNRHSRHYNRQHCRYMRAGITNTTTSKYALSDGKVASTQQLVQMYSTLCTSHLQAMYTRRKKEALEAQQTNQQALELKVEASATQDRCVGSDVLV